MISLPSSELITGENAILQVTVKTEFLGLHLITGYTFISVGIMLPLFYKCTPTQKSFVLKHSFLSFIICMPENVSDVQLLKRPGILNILRFFYFFYEVVKYGSLKVLRVTEKVLQKWVFKHLNHLFGLFHSQQRPSHCP